ncbi:focadhesin-like [Ptychodera flava]|uniref:focadhesin-like n=1 Tax=Ptychodera flava TaxID=63121 RepID=UPI003969CDA0
MLKTLTAMLPGQPSADESPVIQFHCGLGLGSLLSRLYQEHFSEVTGNEGAMATMKALDVLEHSCLTPAIQNTNGCMLGLGLALSSLCGLGATHSRVHVTSTHAKLMALLEVWEDEEKSGISVQTLCMCLACVTVSACNSNYLSAEVGTLVLRKFQSLSQQYPQVPGIATSAGLLCNGLCASGHAGSSDIMDELFQDWMKGVTSVEITPLDQMAMIHGLAALVSMETSFIHLNTDVMMTSEIQSKQNQTVKTLSQIVTSSDDVGLRSNSSWLIAYLYMRSTVGTQTKANVPSSYTYLPDSSVLRAIVDFLITAGKEGPESFSSGEVDVAMTALVNVSKSALPPVNWTAILSPLLRMKFDSEVQLKCIQLAVNQCKSASSASVLIQSWISTSLFAALHDPSKLCLYSSLHILLQGVPMSKVKPFLESSLVEPFTVATLDNSALCRSVLTGLLQALRLADPPQSATLLLYKCVEKIYYLMPNAIQKWQTPLLSSLSDCLCLLPSEVLDRLTNPSEQGNLLKATYIRCYLFSQGKQPIAWLNPCIDVAMATSRSSTHQTVVWWFASSFHQCTTVQTELTGTIQRMDWLLELLGHIKNIAYKKETVSQEDLPTALKFLLDIFAVAVVTWSARNAHLSLGLVSFQSNVSGSHEEVSNAAAMLSPHRSLNFQDIFSEGENVESFAISGMRSLLPNCLQVLLSKQPWNQHIDKVLDWLIVMLDTQQSVLTETCRHTLKDTLCALRHLTGFRKPSHWTRAFNSDN